MSSTVRSAGAVAQVHVDRAGESKGPFELKGHHIRQMALVFAAASWAAVIYTMA